MHVIPQQWMVIMKYKETERHNEICEETEGYDEICEETEGHDEICEEIERHDEICEETVGHDEICEIDRHDAPCYIFTQCASCTYLAVLFHYTFTPCTFCKNA
jgi:hypothetical protein